MDRRRQQRGERNGNGPQAAPGLPSALPPDPPPPAERLLAWFSRCARPLPWRGTRDPYRVWVSEAMLQQTRVATVIPFYGRFLARFPTVAELAAAGEGEVLKHWEGLGYYGRARHLHRAAQAVVREHGGVVPADARAFRALPGVGEYLAAAVLSIARGLPLPAVEGNGLRVAARWGAFDDPVPGPRSTARTRALFQSWLEGLSASGSNGYPGDLNQAVMELGQVLCLPRSPRCSDGCPLAADCRAYARGEPEAYPRRAEKAPRPVRTAVAILLRRGDGLWFERRPSRGLLGGLWDFPQEYRQEGEPVEETAGRLLSRLPAPECTREAGGLERLGTLIHAYTHFTLELHVFHLGCNEPPSRPDTPGGCWVRPVDRERFAFPASVHRVLGWAETKRALDET